MLKTTINKRFRGISGNLNGFLLSLLFICTLTGISQEQATRLTFKADYSGFFRNNEYFEDYVKGYTLTGNHFTPRLALKLNEKATFEVGAHMLKYNGINSFTEVVPYISMKVSPLSDFDVVLGSFNSSERMLLSDKIFSEEHLLTDFIEEGLLLKYRANQFRVQAWLDWEKFIFSGDPFRERFKVGGIALWHSEKNLKTNFQLKVQTLIQHKGGQIDNSGLPVSTIMNHAFSVSLNHDATTLKQFSLAGTFYTFNDLNGNESWVSESGWALDFPVSYQSENTSVTAGYWFADAFIAPYGNPVFQTASLTGPAINMPDNSIAYLVLNYDYDLAQGVRINLGLSNYYLTGFNSFNYHYSIKIIFRQSFFLTNLEKMM